MKGRGWEGWGGGGRGGGGRRESAYWRSVSDGNSFWQIFLYCSSMIFDVKLRIFGSKISRCEREREREREREECMVVYFWVVRATKCTGFYYYYTNLQCVSFCAFVTY